MKAISKKKAAIQSNRIQNGAMYKRVCCTLRSSIGPASGARERSIKYTNARAESKTVELRQKERIQDPNRVSIAQGSFKSETPKSSKIGPFSAVIPRPGIPQSV